MSIGRRFLNLAKSELNSLLDIAAKHTDDDDASEATESLHGYSAKELEEELERRRSARQEVEDAIHGRRSPEPPKGPGAGGARTAGSRAAGSTVGEGTRVQKAYATLEVPQGSDFETVRKSYRNLMRKYHPDHHTESPEKQKAANEVAQRLTEAYKFLEKRIKK
jgi:DnaJ-domain-containing protein 1